MIKGVEDCIGLTEGPCRLEDLHRIAVLPRSYSHDEISAFYHANHRHILHFEDGARMSIARAFLGLSGLSDSLGDRLYALLLIHNFIELNGIEYAATDENIEEFVAFMGRSKPLDSRIRLPMSPRALSALNAGLVSPYMLDISEGDEVRLSEHTFRFMMQRGMDAAALMAYSLKPHEVELVVEYLAKDQCLRSRCTRYIKDQGVINDTTFVIAALLDIPCTPRNVDCAQVYSLFCSRHNSSVHIPFSTFKSAGSMSRFETYYLYLLSKSDYSIDLADINEFFAEAEEHGAVRGTDGEASSACSTPPSSVGASSQRTSLPCSTSPGELASLSFLEELKIPEKDTRDILVSALDLVLSRNADIGFQKYAFTLLLRLESKSYFLRLFCKYAREMINSGLRPTLYGGVYDDVERVISYLRAHCAECAAILRPENAPSCSLEMLDSDLLLSSVDIETRAALPSFGAPYTQHDAGSDTLPGSTALGNVPPEELPVLDFNDFPWIGDHQAALLMERYVKMHPASKLAGNYLRLKGGSNTVDAFFAANYQDIADERDRGLVMCKLGAIIEAETFPQTTIKAIFDASGSLYSLRQIVMHRKDVSRKNIEKFIESLSDEQEGEVNTTVGREVVSKKFILLYIDHLMSKYELSSIMDILGFIMDSYDAQVAARILRHLVSLIREMFFVEAYFDHVGLLCKKAMRFGNSQIAVLNEKILSFVLACGGIMEKDVLIGNLRAA